MKSTNPLRGATALAAVVALVVGAAAPGAADDDRPKKADGEIVGMEVSPHPLDEDFLITDDREAQLPAIAAAGVTCKYESVIHGPNSTPSAGSWQLVYVVPAGEAANSWLDVPRSCSDGSLRYSSLARSSRNMASWMAAQNAGMNYRTLNYSYAHNYTGATYSTRSVRRLVSAYPEENWNNTPMADGSRLTKLRNELDAAGFKAGNTKYMTLLDAAIYKECTRRDAFGNPVCYYIPGQAILGGAYAIANRSWIDESWVERSYRYGCATLGDSIYNHEATHQGGAGHVTDHARDLMSPNGGHGYTMKSSPSVLWDYGRNSYHGTVASSGYVGSGNLGGNYFTC